MGSKPAINCETFSPIHGEEGRGAKILAFGMNIENSKTLTLPRGKNYCEY